MNIHQKMVIFFESTLISVNELDAKRWKRGDIHSILVVAIRYSKNMALMA